MKTYTQLVKLKTFKERFNYLRLKGNVGHTTFGSRRPLNQRLYKSEKWKDAREKAIIRDEGRDLGVEGFEIHSKLLVHHINPITEKDIRSDSDCIYNLNNLITTRHRTHNAIHYNSNCPEYLPIDRRPNDMVPWKKAKREEVQNGRRY